MQVYSLLREWPDLYVYGILILSVPAAYELAVGVRLEEQIERFYAVVIA